MTGIRFVIVLAALVCAAAAEQRSRQPKLFFASVSSSTSTSTSTATVKTNAYCYQITATVSTPCKRKRRSIVSDPLSGDEDSLVPSPSRRQINEVNVAPEASTEDRLSHRGAKLFLLFTSTSTATAAERMQYNRRRCFFYSYPQWNPFKI